VSRIDALPLDRRGYPIPFIVLRDGEGNPVFAANDIQRIALAVRERLCHVCGQALEGEPVWFVGGAGSALLNGSHGAYYDGPMHHECMRFAVEHCPHLAHRMTGPVAPAIQKRLKAQGIATEDRTVLPGTPEIFVAVSPHGGYEFRGGSGYDFKGGIFTVRRPFRKVEYWQGGFLLPVREGEKRARRAARKVDAELASGQPAVRWGAPK